ncbi:hypothetical protein PHMEG_00026159 [Phytophthora megakarya]|uniref:RxLR effector protein n=1 Tax=Phytophthora megakarya TaxID=4795 RepID=A0A225VAD6_9STRA|nr:hypothetical protein PHMEG_00026159 [Phytophthora megakarya]
MRLSLFFLAFATTFLSSTTALSPSATTPLKALRALHEGSNYGGRVLRIHEPYGTAVVEPRSLRGAKTHDKHSVEHGDEEERGGFGKVLNKIRYQSQGAHGADDLNPTLVQQLRDNPRLFEQMRTNDDLRKNIYSAWRGVELHSGEVKTAMKNHGYTQEEYKQFFLTMSIYPEGLPRALHEGNNYGGRVLRIHEPIDEDNSGNQEERGGGTNFLNRFRYQSHGVHAAEDLNQVTMARNYLQYNPTLFSRIRSDSDKRYETYSIWRGAPYHSDEVKRAMKAHGLDAGEVRKFVEEYKAFKPATLSFE